MKNREKLKLIANNPMKYFITAVFKMQCVIFKKKVIFVNSFPKSGSSYVTRVLEEISGFKTHRVVTRFGRNEQDIYLPAIIDAYKSNFITQQHTRATKANIDILNGYKVKPIILVRDIFDIVVSLRDYMLDNPEIFLGYVTEEYINMKESKQYDFVIDLLIPWYFNFYVSWIEAEKLNKIEFIWCRYEDMLNDKNKFFKRIIKYLEITPLKSFESVVYSKNDKKDKVNKAVAGRGQKKLSIEQMEKIFKYASYYSSIDFGRIGINTSVVT